MSTTGKNPSAALIAGIKTALTGVAVGSVTYPVYDTVEKGATNRTYVYIGNYLDNEEGTKDDFVYTGTIAIECVDEGQVQNVRRSTVQGLNNAVRAKLKTSKGAVFSVTGFTLIYFRHAGSTQTYENNNGRATVRIIDIYEFSIE